MRLEEPEELFYLYNVLSGDLARPMDEPMPLFYRVEEEILERFPDVLLAFKAMLRLLVKGKSWPESVLIAILLTANCVWFIKHNVQLFPNVPFTMSKNKGIMVPNNFLIRYGINNNLIWQLTGSNYMDVVLGENSLKKYDLSPDYSVFLEKIRWLFTKEDFHNLMYILHIHLTKPQGLIDIIALCRTDYFSKFLEEI